jgi:proline iminopeptidase
LQRAPGFAVCAVLLLALSASPGAEEAITVHCAGVGEPVYLIGGGPAFTTWHMQPIQDRLGGRFRVCRWDMRGVGDNAELPIDRGSPALSQWLDDMDRVLPRQPSVLWGHSWGALQALLFAGRHPERVKALVLSNPVDPALRSLEGIEAKRHVHQVEAARLDLDDIGTAAEQRHNFRSKIASYFLDGETGWAYSDRFNGADTNNGLNVEIWEDYRRTPLSGADLAALEGKVVGVIQCTHDVLMPETFEEYEKLLASTKQTLLSGCSHFPWVEVPDAYYEALSQSLERLGD